MAKTERSPAQRKADAARSRAMKAAMRKPGGRTVARAKSLAASTKRNKPKLMSLSKMGLLTSMIVLITGFGRGEANRFIVAFNELMDDLGFPRMTAGRLIALLIGLSLLATAWEKFGIKYRAFLRKWNLRP